MLSALIRTSNERGANKSRAYRMSAFRTTSERGEHFDVRDEEGLVQRIAGERDEIAKRLGTAGPLHPEFLCQVRLVLK